MTWVRDDDLVAWYFTLHGASAGTSSQQLRARTAEALGCLHGFGVPRILNLSTFSTGDVEPAVWFGPGGHAEQFLDATKPYLDDLSYVSLRLDVLVRLAPEAHEERVSGAATIRCSVRPGDGSDAPDELSLVLALDVDLYAARTRAPQIDNTVIAELNQPRLRRVLQCFVDVLGAEFEEVDAPAYADQVSPEGFLPVRPMSGS